MRLIILLYTFLWSRYAGRLATQGWTLVLIILQLLTHSSWSVHSIVVQGGQKFRSRSAKICQFRFALVNTVTVFKRSMHVGNFMTRSDANGNILRDNYDPVSPVECVTRALVKECHATWAETPSTTPSHAAKKPAKGLAVSSGAS